MPFSSRALTNVRYGSAPRQCYIFFLKILQIYLWDMLQFPGLVPRSCTEQWPYTWSPSLQASSDLFRYSSLLRASFTLRPLTQVNLIPPTTLTRTPQTRSDGNLFTEPSSAIMMTLLYKLHSSHSQRSGAPEAWTNSETFSGPEGHYLVVKICDPNLIAIPQLTLGHMTINSDRMTWNPNHTSDAVFKMLNDLLKTGIKLAIDVQH